MNRGEDLRRGGSRRSLTAALRYAHKKPHWVDSFYLSIYLSIYNEYSKKKSNIWQRKNYNGAIWRQTRKYNLDTLQIQVHQKYYTFWIHCLKTTSDLASYIEGINEFQSLIVRGKKQTVFICVWMDRNSAEPLRMKLPGLSRLSMKVVRDGYGNLIILDFVHDCDEEMAGNYEKPKKLRVFNFSYQNVMRKSRKYDSNCIFPQRCRFFIIKLW